MKRSAKAFTLIELLVVVSIIALLLSILLPALQKAKTQAKTVICSSQLRQQGIGFYAYASDYKNYPLPILSGNWPFGGLGWNKDGWQQDLNHPGWKPAGQAALFINGYIKTPEFFYCPAASKDATSLGRPLTYETEWLNYYKTYGPGGTQPKVGWFASIYVGYPYWVGYKTGQPYYDDRFVKAVAKNHQSSGSLITVTDAICTADSAGGFGKFEGVEFRPVFANHVTRGKLSGGNVLLNDNSVSWRRMDYLLQNSDTCWRLRLGRVSTPWGQSGVNFWF